MPIIKDSDRKAVQDALADLSTPVEMILFTRAQDCEYCEPTRELLGEVAALSPKITLKVHDLDKDAGLAATYGVDKVPALVLRNEKDYGIRFFGIPAGYEFSTLIDDIKDVSREQHGLSAPILEQLAKVNRPVHIQVLVTPS
ncbi:MAG: thioredoxin family protein [Deltaproteobacteria bacterium]|nr:thioredoxin family protein [Deltaproteobacteria bacterium]